MPTQAIDSLIFKERSSITQRVVHAMCLKAAQQDERKAEKVVGVFCDEGEYFVKKKKKSLIELIDCLPQRLPFLM